MIIPPRYILDRSRDRTNVQRCNQRHGTSYVGARKPSSGAVLSFTLSFLHLVVKPKMQLFSLFIVYCFSLLFSTAQAQCNGNAELCSRKYSNVSQIGSHDSSFVGDLPTENQHFSVTLQLNSGIRFLQAQTHKLLGTIDMCHTSCLEENSGSLKQYLSTIKDWLAASNNTNEVLTLLLVNGDDLDVAQFGSVFSSVGLDSYAYTPKGTLTLDEWPTLQELIDDGKRLVVFMDYEADTSSVPYILDEFTYFFETPYDTTDASFPECSVDRPAGASATGRMYIVNHFLDVDLLGIDVPDETVAATTNSEASIDAQVAICLKNYKYAPQGVLVDYMDMGNVFAAQRDMNNLS